MPSQSPPVISPDQTSPAKPHRGAQGLDFHQALRDGGWRWWRPWLSLIVGFSGVIFLFVLMVFLMGAAFITEAITGAPVVEALNLDDDILEDSPLGFAALNLMLAMGIVIAITATTAAGVRAGLATSVTGRMRWDLLGWGSLISLGVLFVALVLPELVGSEPVEITPDPAWLWFTVLMLLTTPLQAAGEEYLFRGWMAQWIGSWFRRRWLAVLVPMLITSTIFALAHGTQNLWLFSDRLIFGILASLMVWLTGGLELAIALHVVNNLIAFGFALATDTMAESSAITEVSAVEGLWSIGATVLTAVLLVLFARRRSPERTISGA